MNDDPKGMMFAMSLFAAAVIVVSGCWLLYSSRDSASSANRALSQRCEESGGVFVEGVNDMDGTVSQFSVCIPERALYCADFE